MSENLDIKVDPSQQYPELLDAYLAQMETAYSPRNVLFRSNRTIDPLDFWKYLGPQGEKLAGALVGNISFGAAESPCRGVILASNPRQAMRWRSAIAHVLVRTGVSLAAVGPEWHLGEAFRAPSLQAAADSEAVCFVVERTVSESGRTEGRPTLLREQDLCVDGPARVIRFQRREEAVHLLTEQFRCRAVGNLYVPLPPPGIRHMARRKIIYSIHGLKNN